MPRNPMTPKRRTFDYWWTEEEHASDSRTGAYATLRVLRLPAPLPRREAKKRSTDPPKWPTYVWAWVVADRDGTIVGSGRARDQKAARKKARDCADKLPASKAPPDDPDAD